MILKCYFFCTFNSVEEPSMLKFVGDRTAVPYFSNLVWFIGNHVLEVDACLRKPIKEYVNLVFNCIITG